jgi:hypothetical protein
LDNFSFSVLCYNHQEYIIEHLESIRYLTSKYGSGIEVSLIINDDSSEDNSIHLINEWVNKFSSIFKKVTLIFNDNNIGTAKSTINIIEYCNTDYLKITAGDDIYSFENIFLFSTNCDSYSICSGIPLCIENNKIYNNRVDILSIVASKNIYQGSNKRDRFKLLSSNNAPNIVYNIDCLKNRELINFLECFDVVEDFPIQIAISGLPHYNYFQDNIVYTYYRRTQKSTYIIENRRFNKDQDSIFKYLIKDSNSFIEKLLLKNRRYCYWVKNIYIKKLINLSFYIFLFQCFFRFVFIVNDFSQIRFKLTSHQKHLNLIKYKAKLFISRL